MDKYDPNGDGVEAGLTERWGARSGEPHLRESGVHLQVYETLADRKLHLLFELWDKDGDGSISFAELALGLRKFSSPAEPCTETAADAAEVSTFPLASVTQSSLLMTERALVPQDLLM